MGGKVNGRKNLQVVKGSGGPGPTTERLPTPQDVLNLAQQVAKHVVDISIPPLQKEIADVAKVLGEKLAMLFTEEVKTAVMLNSLVELLIEKGIITKEEFKARVDKNSEETKQNYEQVTKAMKAQAGGQDADGRKQAVGGQPVSQPGQGGPAPAGGGGEGLPPQESQANG